MQGSRPLRKGRPVASGGVRVTRVTREVEVAEVEVVVPQLLPTVPANGPLVSSTAFALQDILFDMPFIAFSEDVVAGCMVVSNSQEVLSILINMPAALSFNDVCISTICMIVQYEYAGPLACTWRTGGCQRPWHCGRACRHACA